MPANTEPTPLLWLSSHDRLLAATDERMLALAKEAAAFGQNCAAEAATYHLKTGGQRIRARLALHAGLALGMNPADAVTIAATAELLHNASLVHDDLQDRDVIRRNQPTVWAKFGETVSLCTGDLLLSAAYGALADFSQVQHLPFMITLMHRRTAAAIHGQCGDIDSREQTINSMSVYEQIVAAKSGALLSLPIELAMAGTGRPIASPGVRHAGDAFAIGYQILDDIRDFASDSGQQGKPLALNALRLLQASGHDAAAPTVARQLSAQYLKSAALAAGDLPLGAGKLLSDLALGLAAPLQTSSCQCTPS